MKSKKALGSSKLFVSIVVFWTFAFIISAQVGQHFSNDKGGTRIGTEYCIGLPLVKGVEWCFANPGTFLLDVMTFQVEGVPTAISIMVSMFALFSAYIVFEFFVEILP